MKYVQNKKTVTGHTSILSTQHSSTLAEKTAETAEDAESVEIKKNN